MRTPPRVSCCSDGSPLSRQPVIWLVVALAACAAMATREILKAVRRRPTPLFVPPRQGVRRAHGAIRAPRGQPRQHIVKPQKKRPAVDAGLLGSRYAVRVAKWPGISPTPGGWGADVFRHRVIPSHRGNTDFIAGQLGRRWASLRRKCGFCDLSDRGPLSRRKSCRNQGGGVDRPATQPLMTLA